VDARVTAIQLLGPADARLLANVIDGVFDHPVESTLVSEFLEDPRHHIAVAMDGDRIVGFASAVDYVHPDKPRELWINEVGVAPEYTRRGIAKQLLHLLLDHARAIGCRETWVLTDDANVAANALYRSAGGARVEPAQRMYSFQLSG
jgi:ribosomal protein S18 acetylase RimI-like enzyme